MASHTARVRINDPYVFRSSKKKYRQGLEVCVFETVFSSLRAFTLLGYFQYWGHYVKPHHVPDICQLSPLAGTGKGITVYHFVNDTLNAFS